MKKIIINRENENDSIFVVDNGEIVEVYNELEDKSIENNIYCGIVRNIFPGIQAAFVDIGERKNAFLHIKDIIEKDNNISGNKNLKFEDFDITDYLKPGKSVLVQVQKDSERKKGARVTQNIKLIGRYIVLIPNVKFGTISSKIEDEKEIERLKNISKNIIAQINNDSEKIGVIIRTSAIGKDEKVILEDVKRKIKEWDGIKANFEKEKLKRRPVKIYDDNGIEKRVILRYIDENIGLITNNTEVKVNIEKILLDEKIKNLTVKLEEDCLNSDLKNQIEKKTQRQIWLKCGGFITIDETEALIAIDVNSGKYTGNKKMEKYENIHKVNKEATIEIAKQMRLRNMGGIIIIDYIDMEKDEDRENILKLLQDELKNDRSKTQVLGFTKLDLLEITRKKI